MRADAGGRDAGTPWAHPCSLFKGVVDDARNLHSQNEAPVAHARNLRLSGPAGWDEEGPEK